MSRWSRRLKFCIAGDSRRFESEGEFEGLIVLFPAFGNRKREIGIEHVQVEAGLAGGFEGWVLRIHRWKCAGMCAASKR